MQSVNYLMLPIPLEAAEAAEITPMSIMRCALDESGRLIIEVVHPEHELPDCDGDCYNCSHYNANEDYCDAFDEFIGLEFEEGVGDE